MSNRPEPDDVDLFVGGVESDARSLAETSKIIEEYKKSLDYPLEAEEAERVLAALGINARDYGMQDAESLLKHWHECVAELLKAGHNGTKGTRFDAEDIGVESGFSSEKPK